MAYFLTVLKQVSNNVLVSPKDVCLICDIIFMYVVVIVPIIYASAIPELNPLFLLLYIEM